MKYSFKGQDGTIHTYDAPTRDDAIRQLRADIANPQKPQVKDFGSTPANLFGGFMQGLFDPIESVGQMAEHAPYIGGAVRAAIPQSLRDAAKDMQSRAQASTAGQIGEFGGNVLPFLFQPELGIARAGEAVPYIGKGLGFLGRLGERATLPSVISNPVPQPGDDFWTQKGEQALVGTALGAPLEGVASIVDRLGTRAAAKTAASRETQRAADELSQITGQQEWRRGAGALAHQQGSLDRAAEQRARQAAIDAKKPIPTLTTGGFWARALQHIGESNPDAAGPLPETGAKVRKLVGDRINGIMDRMTLDPHDPSFREAINNERDTVLKDLTESERSGWYARGQERSPLESTITDQYGRPARTTRRDPTRPTGEFATTVLEPLEKGPLSGGDLTAYNRRLGDQAETYVRQAQGRPKAEADELYDRAAALRRIQDAVIGHAAGSAEDKLALEQAHRAYFMWGVGNDAARATNKGIATPRQLIAAYSRRLGKGQAGAAKFNEALRDPANTHHGNAQWLQRQLARHTAEPPTVRPASAVPPKPRQARASRTSAEPTETVSPAAVIGAHAVLAHIPGNHMIPWYMRHPIARAIAPSLQRAARGVHRVAGGARRTEAPVSAGVSNIVKQSEEPDMSYRWPGQ